MPVIDQRRWDSMTYEQQQALIKAVSTDNVLRGIGPSFQEFCAVKENTVTLTKEDLRQRIIAMFVWGFAFGVLIGSLVAMALA